MSRYLLSLDPGKLTGTVLLDYTDMSETQTPTVLYAGEPEQFDVCAWVENLFSEISRGNDPYAHSFAAASEPVSLDIVIERFKISVETGKKNDVDYSLEIIGTVKYLAKKYGFTYTMQTPAEAMNFVDNDRIRALGLWVKGGAGHHKDAMRHAIKYLVFQKGWRPQGLVS